MIHWNIQNWLREQAAKRGQRLIRAALRGWDIAQFEPEPGMWAVVAPPKDTYRTKAYLWADGPVVRCTVTTDICVDRGLLRHELLLQLLEANRPNDLGVFGLVPHSDDRLIVLAFDVNSKSTTPVELRRSVERMIARYQLMVTRLYSMELVIPGPERFHAGPSPASPVVTPVWRKTA